MRQNVLVSICVPTYKREYIVRDMLNSIYSQDVDHSIFEVCITDNSESDETKDMLEKEFSEIDNLYYKKVTCKGFLNSIEALKFGNGKLLKLHNDYSIMKKGALQHLINMIKKYEIIKPEIFFSMNALNNNKVVTEFRDFNNFMYNINYFSTWSTSFSIWKDDFDKLMELGIDVNYMYPHTTLLYKLVDKQLFVVDNFEYVTNLEPKKKGGYNLIDNFVRIYLTMVQEDLLNKNYISDETYKKIENNIIRFTSYWYYTVNHSKNYTFTFENYKQLIKDKCGIRAVVKFIAYNFFYSFKYSIKKILKRG